MSRKTKKPDGRQGRELSSTVEELVTLRAEAEKMGLLASEVWLGPRERAGLLAAIREKTKIDHSPDLVRAVLRGDPEETTLMGLAVRAMTKPGVRVGITIGEPPAECARSRYGRANPRHSPG